MIRGWGEFLIGVVVFVVCVLVLLSAWPGVR